VERRTLLGLNFNVFLLGLVSFLTDVSSEMVMPILPLFIVSLGGAGLAVGLIAGLSESASSVLRVFSGYWSDRYGRRKPFVASGYAASAAAKLFFPLSTTWAHILVLRPLERVGKGLRTAPRDAIIAESLASGVRGRGFGVHRAMDTSGAILGSVSAFLLYWFWGWELRPILWAAALVAFSSLVPLYFVGERRFKPQAKTFKLSLAGLPGNLKLFVAAATVFAMGNLSYMFLILRAQELFAGRAAVAVPLLLYVLLNVVFATLAVPFGVLSDRIGRKGVLFAGYVLFASVCLGFAALSSLPAYVALFVLYGAVYALVEGNQRAFVADFDVKELRGTALGVFHTSVGLAALPANFLAGALWQYVSPAAAFAYAAALSMAAALLLLRVK